MADVRYESLRNDLSVGWNVAAAITVRKATELTIAAGPGRNSFVP